MVLFSYFFAEAIPAYALFYWLWWRFKLRPAPAPWWVHTVVLLALFSQGAIWRLLSAAGGEPKAGSIGAIFIDLLVPAGLSFLAAWVLRHVVVWRQKEPGDQPFALSPGKAALLIGGSVIGTVGLLFVGLVAAVMFSETPQADASSAVNPFQQYAPAKPAPRPQPAINDPWAQPPLEPPPPAGFTVDDPLAETPSDPLARQQSWDQAALDWEQRNVEFLADPAREAAMQRAIDAVEREYGASVGDQRLIELAQDRAFRETGWRVQ